MTPELDIRFDGTHFHVAVPEELQEEAKARYPIGKISFERFMRSLLHTWKVYGGGPMGVSAGDPSGEEAYW